MEFDPEIAALARGGATAGMILDGLKRLCSLCIEETLRKLDRATMTNSLTPELAIALTAEITAYRRIVYRAQQDVDTGRAAAQAQEHRQ
jgi:hypothetical protein